MKKQLRIGAYLRVSTDKQVQVFEGSLETQKFRMEEFVRTRNRETKGWGAIVDFYIDEGISAQSTKRPQYQRMMTDIRSERINMILVADISRLSRNVHDFSTLLKELEECNANYMSLKEQFDSTTPAGRLMTNMVVTMAQFEREQTSERVSINTNSRAIRGLVNGGRAPLGLKRDSFRRGVLVVDEQEASQVRTIFKTFIEQGSIGKTLPVIESMGILPKTKIARWNPSVVRDLLMNPAYVGLREINKLRKEQDPEDLKPWQKYQVVKANWPAIVERQTFDTVQSMLEENAKVERRRLQDKESRIFVLSGILRCGECGRSLCGQSAHGQASIHRYYGHTYKRNSSIECSQGRIRADDVEAAVVKHFTQVAVHGEYFNRIESKLKSALKGAPDRLAEQATELLGQMKSIDKQIASAFKVQAHLDAESSAFEIAAEHLESLAEKKKALKESLMRIEAQERATEAPADLVRRIQESVEEVRRGFKKAPAPLKRRLLRKLLRELILTSSGLEVHFNVGDSVQLNANVFDLDARRAKKTSPVGRNSDLSLSFDNLLIGGNGWGSRTRTYE